MIQYQILWTKSKELQTVSRITNEILRVNHIIPNKCELNNNCYPFLNNSSRNTRSATNIKKNFLQLLFVTIFMVHEIGTLTSPVNQSRLWRNKIPWLFLIVIDNYSLSAQLQKSQCHLHLFHPMAHEQTLHHA